jgi:hypothetical protein
MMPVKISRVGACRSSPSAVREAGGEPLLATVRLEANADFDNGVTLQR